MFIYFTYTFREKGLAASGQNSSELTKSPSWGVVPYGDTGP